MNQLIQHLRIEAKLQMWTIFLFCTLSQVLCLTEEKILYKSANINPGNHIFISCIKEGGKDQLWCRTKGLKSLPTQRTRHLRNKYLFIGRIPRILKTPPWLCLMVTTSQTRDQPPSTEDLSEGFRYNQSNSNKILDTGTCGNLGP